MPIYEFKCMNCNEFIEILILNKSQEVEMRCPKCSSEELERVLSSANYSMGGRSGARPGVASQTRTCSGGSCTTYDLPGPTE
jgi:putative FmdB family regulatory protein